MSDDRRGGTNGHKHDGGEEPGSGEAGEEGLVAEVGHGIGELTRTINTRRVRPVCARTGKLLRLRKVPPAAPGNG
jgi:hypothetical protein